VTFTTTRDNAGTCTITVGDLLCTFEIREAAPTPEPVSEPTPEPAPEPEPTTNWGLISGIIAAAVVVAAGLSGYFLWWRRKTAK